MFRRPAHHPRFATGAADSQSTYLQLRRAHLALGQCHAAFRFAFGGRRQALAKTDLAHGHRVGADGKGIVAGGGEVVDAEHQFGIGQGASACQFFACGPFAGIQRTEQRCRARGEIDCGREAQRRISRINRRR